MTRQGIEIEDSTEGGAIAAWAGVTVLPARYLALILPEVLLGTMALSRDFLPYIPGLLNWVLAMDEEVATETVKNYEESVPSLLAMKARTLVETNPIADWLDNFVVYEQEAKTNIGVAKRDKDSNSPHWYLDTDRWLYPNYAEYCHNSGTRPVSLRRFVTLLSDLGKNQLNLEIRRERDRFGSYFVGLKIRDESDSSPPLITGNSEVVINANPKLDNTNVISKLWTMVMDKVTDMIDSVMDETIDVNKCDEGPKGRREASALAYRSAYDGIIKKSRQSKNQVKPLSKCNTNNQEQKLEQEILEEVLEMPSPSLPKEAQSQRGQGATDNQFVITVGSRVTITDCPAHWLWASPFTVRAIESDLVALDMVDELIKIGRLQKCQK